MGDKSKKTSEVPRRKPLKFTPKIPPRKKTNPEISEMKPPDEAENIVDKELLQRLKLPHEGSKSKSAMIPITFPDEEFSEASASSTPDENCINPAEELGLLKESEKTRMLFFQLPQSLPFVKLPPVAGRGKEIEGHASALEKGRSLQELPAGYMGKMMVYKSGKVKMKLGDTLFDVSPGVKRTFPEDVAAINTKEKHCCIIGNIDKHVVVTPDLDSLLDDGGNQLALSSKKECVGPSQQNEGIPLNSGDTRKEDESEDNHPLFFQLPSSLQVAKQPNASAAAASVKGREIKAEGKYWARDATSSRLKRIEDKSAKKSDGNIEEDAGV